ncbi:MAG: ABC transporter permease [Ignavibacteriales bacterium]|nr:ABC transporter permease [Ignavibacteriales bacterium]
MLANYFKVAYRNASRHKLFAFINVFGLALSLSFCLLVIMIIVDQTSFDRFHPRPDDVYRVLTNAHRKDGGIENYASSPFPLGEVLAAESPAVGKIVHVVRGLSGEANLGSNRVAVNGFFTGPSFFEVFGFTLGKGTAREALVRPHSVVITQETAGKLFGENEAIGKTVTLRGYGDFVVTGVLAKPPGKSHLEFDMLGSLSSLPVLEREGSTGSVLTNWNNYYSNYSYVQLKAGHDPGELEPLLASTQERFYGQLELESRDKGYTFELEPLTEISPGRILSQNVGRALPQLVLTILSGLALIGMIAALFNYTNLTLARALARAKEIGLRKVVGAGRQQLFIQFVSESVFTALAALLLAVAFLQTVLVPGFQTMQIAESADITLEVQPIIGILFLGFTIIIGLVAGILPASVMSGFRPAAILKDVSRVRVFSGLTLRKTLLVLQFTMALVLFIVLTVMQRQVTHALTMEYGFQWQNTMTVRLQGQDAVRAAQVFSQQQNVKSVAAMSHHPLTWEDGSGDVRVKKSDEATGVRHYDVDANFVDLFGLDFVAGGNFHKDLPRSNERLVLVNERFVERFNLGSPLDAVGRSLIVGDSMEVRIAGVLKDFYYKPATYELEPLLLRFTPANWNVLAVRLGDGDRSETRRFFEESWKKLDPFHPFEGRMYGDIIEEVYDTFGDMISIVGSLALLAFGISLLGLLGIVTFQVESRAREIGIRKILGAGLRNLVVLLARRELTLLSISTILAVPLGLFISSEFLTSFAHRIDLGVSVLLPGILLIYFCAGVTIAVQTVRAVGANPADTLKSE